MAEIETTKSNRVLTAPGIGRKLTYKRQERRFLQRAVKQAAHPSLFPSTSLSAMEFEVALDELAEGSEHRTVPVADVFSREHIYADHD